MGPLPAAIPPTIITNPTYLQEFRGPPSAHSTLDDATMPCERALRALKKKKNGELVRDQDPKNRTTRLRHTSHGEFFCLGVSSPAGPHDERGERTVTGFNRRFLWICLNPPVWNRYGESHRRVTEGVFRAGFYHLRHMHTCTTTRRETHSSKNKR